jgi:hypothetical protein
MKPKFKVGDRVKWKDKPFLSNGYVLKVVTYAFDSCYYIVHTDNKAPNEYAWDTDKLLAWSNDIEKEDTL